jgi:acyl carrier protein
MSNYTFEELRNIIISFIEPKLIKSGFDKNKLIDSTDLLGEGILDSFDFIDLVVYIEDQTHISVDLSQLNFDIFTTLGGFINEVLSQQK